MGLGTGFAKLPLAVGLFLLILAPEVHAGPKDREPKHLLRKAGQLARLYNWYRAGPLYAEAERLFEQAGDKRNALYAKIGRIHSQWETMSSLEVSEYLAAELENPLAQNDPELRLWILETKGAVDIEVDLTSARRVWSEARDLARELGDPAREARASGELGIITFMEGDSTEALELLSKALKTSIELRDVGAHIRYLNLAGGTLTRFGRPEDAIRYYDRALRLVRSTPELDSSVLAMTGKARALVALGRRAEAERLYQGSLRRARRRDRRGLAASVLIELGDMAAQGDEHHKAMTYYQEAAELATAGNYQRLVATAAFGLADAWRALGDLENAEESAAEGVVASQRIGEMYELPERLAILAKLKVDRGDFAGADRLYERAADVVDGLLVTLVSPSARSSLVGVMSEIYLEHFDLAAGKLNDPERAFEVLERARGRTAADVLRTRRRQTVSAAGGRTPAQREITRLQIRLMRTEDADGRTTLLEQLFEAEQHLYAESTSRMQQILGKGRPVSITALRDTLREDELVLEYALSDENSYCLVIDDREIQAVRLPKRDRIEAAVSSYLQQIRSRQPGDRAAAELYSVLLGSMPRRVQKKKLIIVPDGNLHLLPFDALTDDRGQYVLKTHVVTYAPSATVLHLLRSEPSEKRASLPLLAVGDVPYGYDNGDGSGKQVASKPVRGIFDLKGADLPPLPSTAEEVISIGDMAGERSILLMGREATEDGFRAQPLDRIRILHMAVHGISSSTAPERAALVLARPQNDEEDGLLQSREISELDLAAELVTLSACDTSVGRLVGQEGIVNLVRAFLFAGARSVVASLWSADDVFTTSLMKRFYGHLADGAERGVALRQAKLELVERFGDQALPFFWAGFTMVGDSSRPVELPD